MSNLVGLIRRRWILPTLIPGLLLLLPLLVVPAKAQVGGLQVTIEWPNERETLYSGLSSLIYKVPIHGRVFSDAHSLEEIEVRLEIFHGGAKIGSLTSAAGADGTYAFHVTVNPGASTQEFPIGFYDCQDVCHSAGELSLQPGELQLRVTAVDPAGNRATAERLILVDRAQEAIVPVQVMTAGSGGSPVPGVTVLASTRVYLWRARFAAGASDDMGLANIGVEALSQAPTEYVFQVAPTVVDGVLYRGVAPAWVTLPPGSLDGPSVILEVTSHRGQITGDLSDLGGQNPGDFSIWAIRLPQGEAFSQTPGPDGGFQFNELPVARYVLAVESARSDPGLLLAVGPELDLAEDPETGQSMALGEGALPGFSGRLVEAGGDPVPFGWITPERVGRTREVLPGSGAFSFTGLPDQQLTLILSAPGFYSRAEVVGPGDESFGPFSLTRRPETQAVAWGPGELVLPPETQAELGDGELSVKSGWIWGRGGSGSLLAVEAAGSVIKVDRGDFALEVLPGERAWFYLLEGSAEITAPSLEEAVRVEGEQMVNLLAGEALTPVAYNSVVVAALRPPRIDPIPLVWEPSLGDQIRNRLARMGVGTAQVVTYITYLTVFLSLVLAPLAFIYWWMRRSKTPPDPSGNSTG